MNTQNTAPDSFYQDMIQAMPLERIYGSYQKPETLIRLESLVAKHKIDLDSIGFYLYTGKPYMPAPTDIIPFATTGGDGCYFAFLTDFGYYENLENAPIVFISPSDFDAKIPHLANKLFASNIRDFLRVMIILQNAEMVRFKNLPDMDFENELNDWQAEMLSDSSGHSLEISKETIAAIKQEFELDEIENLQEYYIMLEKERKENDFLEAKDGLGIRTRLDPNFSNADFSDKATLDEALSKASKAQRLRFYREAPYIYKHFEEEYDEVLLLAAKYLDADGFARESGILKFEVEHSYK